MPSDPNGPGLIAALAGLGLTLGILTGLFGVGGGFMLSPLLNVLFGVDYSLAVGSSLCFILGTSGSALARHLRLGHVEIKTALLMAGGAAAGTILGGMTHQTLRIRMGGANHFTLTLHILFIGLLIFTIMMMLNGPPASRAGAPLLQRLLLPPFVELPTAGISHVSLFGLCFLGLVVGLLTGLLGIGGGVLMVPALVILVGLGAHQAVGTSLGVVLVGSLVGTVQYGLKGNVSLPIAMELLIGSTVGVQIGSWICRRLKARRLRRYFTLLIVLVIVMILWDIIANRK